MDLVFIHSRLANTVFLFMFAIGAWGLVNYFRGQGISSSYWGALVIGEIVALAQGLLGILLVLTVRPPTDLIHILYGALTGLILPGIYVYTHARNGRVEMGLYALAALFIFGLGLRAITTGG